MRALLVSIALVAALCLSMPTPWADTPPTGSFKIAAGASCQSVFKTCASRCKSRAPGDKACVPENCAPKLADCRQTGCWDEGVLYGGAKQCGLQK